jgi:hypothetical protein
MRGTVTRLSRLEAKRGLKGDPSFYVFGLDEDDAAERLAVETVAGTVRLGDRCHMVVWSSSGPLPSPRWLTPREMSDDELNAAIRHFDGLLGREPLPVDANGDVLSSEISELRREIGREGLLNPA